MIHSPGLNEDKAISSPIHEAVEDLLLAGFFEVDAELVAFDGFDAAVAEFEVEHSFTDGVLRSPAVVGGAGDEVAVDGEGAGAAAVLALGSCALPAGGFVDAVE